MYEYLNNADQNVNSSLVVGILNALPYTAIILNNSREIVFANNVSISSTFNITTEEFIGKRLGEAFNCIHFINNSESCGETAKCKFCGTANVIIESQLTKKTKTQESRITRIIDDTEYSFEFQVTASPFIWEDKDYTLLTMIDISDQTRKQVLERIFFHDILNKSGNLSGFFQLIKQKQSQEEQKVLLDIAETISNDLNEEIISQKEILAAESGDLFVEIDYCNSKRVIETIKNQLTYHTAFKEHIIEIDSTCIDVKLKTDIVLLKRILTNMLKNALEASGYNDKVKIGCKLYKNLLQFYVHNIKSIPENIQLQIFQRSFSTKGADRGLGTYSMKLLGERYLKGKVHFTSNNEVGTIFYFELPIQI